MTRGSSESGQALPIYITVVAGLLLLAFAYFAVGMASVSRNSTQSAADAAALAAAQDARDGLQSDLLKLFDPDVWEDLLNGERLGDVLGPCGEAAAFAEKNGAERVSCNPVYFPAGFTVKAKSRKPMGKSLIPGTETKYATATATAVIRPRCRIREAEIAEDENEKKHELICEGRNSPIEVDPARLGEILPDPGTLFSVHLADR